MLRGLYIGSTGMLMNQHQMDVISNNLANVNKTAFKRDEAVFKSFPEMLIQRTREDGLGHVPLGSFDIAPIVGKLGMGAEFNENFTHFEQGGAHKTDNPFDLMLESNNSEHPAFFVVLTDKGERLSRNGSFTLNKDGNLATPQGFLLMGEDGPIKVAAHNVLFREDGEVWINTEFGNEPDAPVSDKNNTWSNPTVLNKIKIRTIEFPREIRKEGHSFYNITPESGPMLSFDDFGETQGATIRQGFLETSNVNLVHQMVSMIAVQRNYEANQKSVTSHNQLLGKLINEVAR